MPFNDESGFTPDSFNDIMTRLREGINSKFSVNFTEEDFVGTNFYKFSYTLAQEVLAREIEFSEAYAKLQDYIRAQNINLAAPKTPVEGLIAAFKDEGYIISVRPMTLATAGKIGVCVDVDSEAEDYAEKKQSILSLLNTYTVGGIYFDGTESGNVVLSNGQSFPFAFYTPIKYEAYLKLTISLSTNSNILKDDDDAIKQILLKNLAELYALGRNFEPDRYFNIYRDAQYASSVKLEWKTTAEGTYSDAVFAADFRDLFTFSSDRIEVITS